MGGDEAGGEDPSRRERDVLAENHQHGGLERVGAAGHAQVRSGPDQRPEPGVARECCDPGSRVCVETEPAAADSGGRGHGIRCAGGVDARDADGPRRQGDGERREGTCRVAHEPAVPARPVGEHLDVVETRHAVRDEERPQRRQIHEVGAHRSIKPHVPRPAHGHRLADMADTPFFDPWPEPDQDHDDQQQEVDLPWMPPVHVVGQVVPTAATVFRSDDVAVVVTHVVAYRRGLELHVRTWLRPGTRREPSSTEDLWREQEPRVGVRLADGTRLGHRPAHAAPDEAGPTTSPFAQTSGEGGGLSSSSSWWLNPVPEGHTLDVVVAWDAQGVPESSVALDLAPLRAAAASETVLWDPPPPGEGAGFGWFAYAPMSGSAYGSSWAVSFDEPGAEGDPEREQD